MVVLCVSEPDVPVTVTVLVPVVAVEDAVKVKVDVALPFAGGVTGLGEKAAVTPLGSPEALSVVAELNPLRLVTVMVLVAVDPRVTLTALGDADTLKPGVPAPTAKIRSS
jgi:predicted cation transporter